MIEVSPIQMLGIVPVISLLRDQIHTTHEDQLENQGIGYNADGDRWPANCGVFTRIGLKIYKKNCAYVKGSGGHQDRHEDRCLRLPVPVPD